MRIAVAAADHASFTEAARRLDLAPAQVSKKIAALERHLGARLFERTTRSVTLTAAGAAYVERARIVLCDLDAMEDGVREAQASASGLLRVTAPVVFGARVLTPIVMAFMEAHPQVEVRVNLSDRMVDLVEEGLDVAIRIGQLADSSLIARRLAPAHLVLAASPGFLAATPIAHPRDLEDVRCVIDTNYPTPKRWSFSRGDERVEAAVDGPLHVNSAEAAAEAAAAGFGAVLSPNFVCDEYLASGRLVRAADGWTAEHRDIWAVFAQNRFVATRVRLFVDHLAAALGRG